MPSRKQPAGPFAIRLTQAQRKTVAGLVPYLASRLKLGERNQRTIEFTLTDLRQIQTKARAGIDRASTGAQRNTLRHITDLAGAALDRSRGSGAIPAPQRVFQFKITLVESRPPVWRRIQVKNCTLDKLHEHIQTAMGWTNSHLHQFRINNRRYADPMLMEEDFEEWGCEDSTGTTLTDILPADGKRFRFGYEYDFGDSWEHEILFEGVKRAKPGERYPICVEGKRACPPEDVGGVWGYASFLEAIQDPEHERHDELLNWVGGSFDPEDFDPAAATMRMTRGLPNWREWV
jgi:hypothetical protein